MALCSDLPQMLGKQALLPEPRWVGHVIGTLQALLALLVLSVYGPGLGFDFFVGPLALVVATIALAALTIAVQRRRRAADKDALA